MRIKVVRGSSPGGLTRYLLREDKQKPSTQEEREQGSPVFHTNMFGRNEEELTEEFRFSHNLNSQVKNTMVHYAISLPPGENPAIETKQVIVDRLLEKRGHGKCQFFAVEHFDKLEKNNVHHFHVAASTIRRDGSWVSDKFERIKLKPIEREIEQELNLTYCPSRREEERRNLTTGEYRLKARTGYDLPKEKLWSAIDQAASDQPSMSLLIARLRSQDISVRLRQQNGQPTGISYELDRIAFPGYKLGKAYSFKGLQKHLGVYTLPEQDQQLQALSQMSPQETQALIDEHENYQAHYDPLYQHYNPQISLPPEERDRHTLRRALADNIEPKEAAALISWSSEQAEFIKRTQGKEAAANYALELTENELTLAKQRQPNRKRDRGMEL